MDKKEFIVTTAKDILVAAMAKDSQVKLRFNAKCGDTHLADIESHLIAISKSVEIALMGLKD